MKNFILYIFITIILGSCASNKTKKNNSVEAYNYSSMENKTFFNAIFKKSDFDALKITSKIEVQNGKLIPNINATIYIENDQKVWMNMSSLFFNIARGIATPQGLKAYEKIDKTYIDSDFSYLNKILNINFLNYNSLQNLLVGKIFIPINEKDFNLTQKDNNYFLKSKEIQKITIDGKISEYLIDLQYSPSFDLIQVQLKDPKSTNELQLFYENWTNINKQRLPQNVKIIIKGKKTRNLNFSKWTHLIAFLTIIKREIYNDIKKNKPIYRNFMCKSSVLTENKGGFAKAKC